MGSCRKLRRNLTHNEALWNDTLWKLSQNETLWNETLWNLTHNETLWSETLWNLTHNETLWNETLWNLTQNESFYIFVQNETSNATLLHNLLNLAEESNVHVIVGLWRSHRRALGPARREKDRYRGAGQFHE